MQEGTFQISSHPVPWSNQVHLLRALLSSQHIQGLTLHSNALLSDFLQYLTPGIVKTLFLIMNWNFLCCNLCPLSPTLSLCFPEKTLVLYTLFSAAENSNKISPSFEHKASRLNYFLEKQSQRHLQEEIVFSKIFYGYETLWGYKTFDGKCASIFPYQFYPSLSYFLFHPNPQHSKEILQFRRGTTNSAADQSAP